MEKWILKAVVQKTISYLPFKNQINYFFQKYITKGVILSDAHFELKIGHARDHISFFRKHNKNEISNWENKRCIELGSGWYPVVPVSLFLNGMGSVTSIDINQWMNKESVLLTIKHFISWKESGRLDKYLDGIDARRWEVLIDIFTNQKQYSFEVICKELNLELMLKDARHTGLADASIDFICSNNTFEHIPRNILFGIIKEFKRIIKKDGVMSHFIDLSDHFAHFDKSITIYNFLKYSDRRWQLIDNSIQPQNRLRFKEYRNMYISLGLPITEEEIRSGDSEALDQVNINPEFEKFSKEELAVSHGYIVSKI